MKDKRSMNVDIQAPLESELDLLHLPVRGVEHEEAVIWREGQPIAMRAHRQIC